MLKSLVRAVFGTRHQRELKRLQPIVAEINREFDRLKNVSDDELRGQTERFRAAIREATAEAEAEVAELRARRRASEDAAEREALSQQIGAAEQRLKAELEAVLDDILPEAFATVKAAAHRLVGSEVSVTGQPLTWDMVHYDVQLIGGLALHQGKVAEMATGEGKTLVATLPLYLNALAGRGAHLVTVNSYLAQRDSEWMGHLYRYLGLTVGCIDLHEPNTPERREAYGADITYGTNNEFGFDYLRDNMVHALEHRVQRGHHYAIVDEVDSVLIDEARTPLIISGPVGSEANAAYARYNPAVADLARRQTRLVNDLIAQAEKDLAGGDSYAAGEKLFLSRRGSPRNKRLQKLLADDPGLVRVISKVERDYMMEKRVHELEENLLYSMDEKGHTIHLTDQGLDVLAPDDHEAFVVPDISEAVHRVEEDPSLDVDQKRERKDELEREYAEKSEKIHIIHQLLKAYTLFNRDEQYVIQNGEVMIVDEFTGRMMPGRRWSDGLHQAVEAKEGVAVRAETQTLATITIQNYFRMYDKLGGMTGTAETEEGEFHQIYTLDVMVIPTNRPISRDDRHDLVYKTRREKLNAIVEEVRRLHMMELPVLVGTVNVDVSETLSRMLKRAGVPHQVLNAKYHQREAEIVALAGQPGAVTIATNMAGRGTDIKLGAGVREPRTVAWAKGRGLDLAALSKVPDPNEVVDLTVQPDSHLIETGGLHIIGSERHESRRIDRQLRGRAGRQGDPGASQFFLSLEDDLMRLFGSERIAAIMDRLGAEEGEVITHPWITNSIGGAQKRVEMQNFEARKRLLDYDDVMNQQREVIYDLRTFALEGGEELKGEVWEMIERALPPVIEEYAAAGTTSDEWDLAGLRQRLLLDFFINADRLPNENGQGDRFPGREDLEEYVVDRAREQYHDKLDRFGEAADAVLRFVVLSTIDEKWKDHLYDLDHLKASIGFRGWGQKDPLLEYKKEAYDMFEDLMTDMYASIARFVFRAQLAPSAPPPPPPPMTFSGPDPDAELGVADEALELPAPARPQPPAPPEAPQRPQAPQPPRRPSIGVNPYTAVQPRPQPQQTNREETPPPAAGVPAGQVVGRNDPCPCGSGKKYKQCHGRNA
ncbi:preprotein translocase subunit SecA [Longimicrobium sp.]|uniref:preprotein translocase subunit SecA n=1 Tax=Longimicrobium sp. TaxID=2029185 RepID=UPI002E3064FE|nr:preprotein translocase subunit SecA [Longimicrobium sp.]HEX6039037.1 preprotein translocase subunit SecA [Longimicrobium sp.]